MAKGGRSFDHFDVWLRNSYSKADSKVLRFGRERNSEWQVANLELPGIMSDLVLNDERDCPCSWLWFTSKAVEHWKPGPVEQ